MRQIQSERMSIILVMWLIILLLITGCEPTGYCTFPHFLWEPLQDGSERKWLSRTEYVDNTRTWTKQKEIVVHQTEILVAHRMHASCNGYEPDTVVPCYRQTIVYRLICISEEPNNKFRVQQHSHSGTFQFTCLRFERRNKSIVQLYSAVPKEVNEDRLCYNSSLQREDWPWIAPQRDEWHFSPVSGGYDFRAYAGDKSKKLCPDEWRASRMESECILGESIRFYFPREKCSPFMHRESEFELESWGDWDEGSYKFILLAEPSHGPRYVLRLPLDMDGEPRMTAMFYFCAVLPLSGRGQPPGRVMYLELRMTRSESGLCFDESSSCEEYAREGKCSNSALHEYGNHCKKACGLCNFAPSNRPECNFPEAFWGDWVLFDEGGMDEIAVDAGLLHSKLLGSFICKSKHWEQDYYKALSIYSNGCRPRYSCLHLLDLGSGVPQYRISRSSLTDQSFKACHFVDDPTPLHDTIRSHQLKNLFPVAKMQFGSCGLSGIVHVNATFSDQTSCEGTMSDIDQHRCNVKSTLQFAFHSCPHRITPEYRCIAYSYLPQGTSFFVTEPLHQGAPHTQCWVVKSNTGRRFTSSLKEIYQFNRVTCATGAIIYPSEHAHDIVAIETFEDYVENPCDKRVSSTIVKPFARLLQNSTAHERNVAAHSTHAPAHASEDGKHRSSSRRRKQDYRTEGSTHLNPIGTSNSALVVCRHYMDLHHLCILALVISRGAVHITLQVR